MKQKTLILYGTRKGTTSKTVEVIADILSGEFSHEVEICNVRNYKSVKKRMNDFNNIIIGSSIVSGKWVHKCLSILKKHDARGQNLMVFVTAGGTMNKVKKYGISKPEATREGIENYIDKYLDKYGIHVLSKMTFGGKVVKKNKVRYDNWNMDDIKQWASDIGQQISDGIE